MINKQCLMRLRSALMYVFLFSSPFNVCNVHVSVNLCNIVLYMFGFNIYRALLLSFQRHIHKYIYDKSSPILSQNADRLQYVAHRSEETRERKREKGKGKEIKRNEQIKMKSTINKSMKHDMPSTNMLGTHTRSLSFIHSFIAHTFYSCFNTKNIVSRMCVCSYKYMCMGSNNSNIICR